MTDVASQHIHTILTGIHHQKFWNVIIIFCNRIVFLDLQCIFGFKMVN